MENENLEKGKIEEIKDTLRKVRDEIILIRSELHKIKQREEASS